ncbi:MAG TPA: hypothetical protein VKA84_07225 [Gemmatimonadaceae bacterium]|nr:hypothetical protein [Gemmatimonadaceae bacterium]
MAGLSVRARQAAAPLAPLAPLALLALLTACRGGGDARYPGPYGREVADAVPRIEESIGLKFKTPPKLEVRSKDQVRKFLEQQFDESRAAKELAGQEVAYKRFGLLPDTLQLRAMFVNLLTEQIIGFYDPASKTLYIVQGSAPDLAGMIVRHELVHALQDQYLNLDSLQNADIDNDHRLAAQSVIEGQAVYDQVGKNVAAIGGWDRVRDVIRQQQGSMPQFSRAPLIVQETLLFPYLTGADFTRRFLQANPGKLPFGKLPESSEQVMHESAYSLAGAGDAPTAIALPGPRNATIVYENNLGEFETRIFLYQHLEDQQGAFRGASGWDGDRYALLRTPAGDALVWVSVWDSGVEAAEFHDLMKRVVDRRKAALGASRSVSVETLEIQGRAAVLYADVPAGVDARTLIPTSGIKLSQ